MRYELDSNGYVTTVLWGCNTGKCAKYTGSIPVGYNSLREWADNACINAYRITGSGNLLLDPAREAALKAEYEQQAIDNAPVSHKEFVETCSGLIESCNNKIEIEKVWENDLPASSFGAQTIFLDLKDCDGVIVTEGLLPSENELEENIFCRMGKITAPSQVYYAGIHRRTITVNENGVTFGHCVRYNTYMQSSDSTMYNDRLVPLTIYTVKGIIGT